MDQAGFNIFEAVGFFADVHNSLDSDMPPLQQPDGLWPKIGDLDSARSLPVHADDFWDFRSLCALGAVLFDLPELKSDSASPGGEVVWLLGSEGVEKWQAMNVTEDSRHTALPCSGYVAARSDNGPRADWFLFDAGPLAAGVHDDATPSTAHGHDDVLNLLLRLEGQPVLVDSGLPFYAGDPAWIEYFRGPAAHNTIEVDGAAWARPTGRLAWSHVQSKPRLDANLTDELWVVRAQLELKEGVTIERNVLGLPGVGVWVADLVNSHQPRLSRWYWQLPESRHPKLIQRNSRFVEIGLDGGALACWTDRLGWKANIEAAANDSPVGWQAPGYGQLIPGHRVVFEASPTVERLVVTSVGRSCTAAAVRVGSHRLTCVRPGESFPDTGDNACDVPRDADVTWQVETSAGLVLIAIYGHSEGDVERQSDSPQRDSSVTSLPASWRRVRGTGDLRVAKRVIALNHTT